MSEGDHELIAIKANVEKITFIRDPDSDVPHAILYDREGGKSVIHHDALHDRWLFKYRYAGHEDPEPFDTVLPMKGIYATGQELRGECGDAKAYDDFMKRTK